MTPPSYLRSSLLARPQLTVSVRASIMSSVRLARWVRPFGYLAFFWILVGASSLTTALPQPNQQGRDSEKVDPLIRVLYSRVSHPPGPLLAISSNELNNINDVGNPAFMNPQHQFASVRHTSTVQGCSRKCLDPHPNAFRFWYGQQNGCWVQVWRSWPEGCQHYQWFNSCNRYWDLHPNGAPKVNWTCCVH